MPRQALIADIRDEARVRAVFEAWRPELVFHAAALKHVPMVEANPLEGLLTNVAGTRHVADAARAVGRAGDGADLHRQGGEPDQRDGRLEAAGRDVLPGARHRGARRRPAAACAASPCASATCWARTGSVVPLFQRQLERGGPLTVTHPDMQRYFMTVREAVGLVLQASVIGVGEAALPASASRAASSCSTWASR